jgi:hypothetical protein
MAIVVGNVLQTPLLKFHDGNDAKTHVGKLAKGCVMNDEDTNAQKLQHFQLTTHYNKMCPCTPSDFTGF